MTARQREPGESRRATTHTNVIEMLGSSESKLEQLGKRLDALGAHLQRSPPQRESALQGRLGVAREALGRVRALYESRIGLPSEVAEELSEAIDGVDAGLKPSAETALRSPEKRRSRILAACAVLDGGLAMAFTNEKESAGGARRKAVARYESAIHALTAELEIAAACRLLLAPYRGRARSDRRQELRAEISALRAQLEVPRSRLAEHRRRAAVDRRRVDRKLCEDVDAVAAALERWLP